MLQCHNGMASELNAQGTRGVNVHEGDDDVHDDVDENDYDDDDGDDDDDGVDWLISVSPN